jgi:4-aminobutyrate aminotransferase-like enzyme
VSHSCAFCNAIEQKNLIDSEYNAMVISSFHFFTFRLLCVLCITMNLRQLFLQHIAQTSAAPLCLEIVKAEGCILTDVNGKEYIDLIGGISVANIGHRHPKVLTAIHQQLDAYMHIMVYGEFVQSPQVQYAKLLTDNLHHH